MSKLTPEILEEIKKARTQLSASLDHFRYLDLGGMAIANHRAETLGARLKAQQALVDLKYYERLAGLQETDETIPASNMYPEAEL